jgi:phenylacetate-CoA ligase
MLAARELVLLRQTLEYAQSFVPYYRRLFEREGFKVTSFLRLSDMLDLPILTKVTIGSQIDDFVSQVPGLHVNSLVCTSGTTGNVRLPRVISDEELEACALLSTITRPRHTPSSGGDILLRVLPTMRRYMGSGRNADVPQILVTLSLHYPKYGLQRSNYEDFVIKQLFEKFPVPGTAGYVTAVHTTPPFLMRIISDELSARGLSPSDTHVRCIACTGGVVTNRTRALVKDFWQVPMLTSYSLSEFNGYAVGCEVHPNRYHFDASVYAEIVDPVDNKPVPEGQEGLLLLTSLYPFQQAQVFIRYDTGDLVAFAGRTCHCGHVGTSIEYRGRVNHCVDLAGVVPNATRRFLASSDIHDVLEDMPQVPSLLYPRFEMSRLEQDGSIKLQLTTEVYQIAGPDMLANFKKRLLSKILDRYPALDLLLEQKRLSWETRVCNRGEIGSYFRLYPDS